MITKEKFENDGVAFFPSVIDFDDIQNFLDQVPAIFEEPIYRTQQNMRCRYAIEPETGNSVLDAIDPIIDLSLAGKSIAYSTNLIELLSGLYGENPCLFKDKYIFRSSKAPGYPPHQDFISWPFFPKSFLTALVALDPISEKNGGLSFYRGSHKQGLLTPADGDFHSIARANLDAFEKVSFTMRPGDVVIFNAFIVHESTSNLSGRPRRSFYLSYNAVSDGGDQREAHYRYFHNWLRKRFGEYGDDRLFFK